MYRVVLVDDDRIVRQGLSTNIPWKNLDCVLLGSFANGRTALESFLANPVDIVLTDIGMPFMDGLELTEKILDEYPDTKIVLMTGHDEFHYVQKALNLGALDYLLKPIRRDVLVSTLTKATKSVDATRRTKQLVAWGLEHEQEELLRALLTGEMENVDRLQEFANSLFLGKAYAVDVIRMDDLAVAHKVRETLSDAMQLVPPKVRVFVLHTPLEIILVYNFKAEDKGAALAVESFQHLISKKLLPSANDHLQCSFSTVHCGWDAVRRAYQEANACLNTHIGKNAFDEKGLKSIAQSIVIKIVIGLTVEACQLIDDAEKICLKGPMLLSEAKTLVQSIVDHSVALKPGCYDQEVGMLVDTADSVTGTFDGLRHFVQNQRDSGKSPSQKLKVLEKSMGYIVEHLDDESLGLSTVADEVAVSSVYLSSLFKTEANVNFTEFVRTNRMLVAMELIRSTDLRVYEIATRVGYLNSQYFTTSFKKFTGVSPVEFKTSVSNDFPTGRHAIES